MSLQKVNLVCVYLKQLPTHNLVRHSKHKHRALSILTFLGVFFVQSNLRVLENKSGTSSGCHFKKIVFQFYFFLVFNFFQLIFISGCTGSSLWCSDFLQLQQPGSTLHCSAWTSHWSGFCCCGVQALGCIGFSSGGMRAQKLLLSGSRAQVQQLQCMSLVVPQHV